MAHEDDPELQEALRRSLEQTNLQESQLADALAESMRTRDHEIARNMQGYHLSQIEQDLMSQSRPKREETSRYMEAQLLSDRSVAEKEREQKWQVVGDQTVRRPRYVPLNVEIGSRGCFDNSAGADMRPNTSGPGGPSKPRPGPIIDHASRLQQEIPYRPPNLHRSDSSTPAISDETVTSMTPKPVNQSVNGSDSISITTIRHYRRPAVHQPGTRQHPGNLNMTNEPLVVIDGQNVGCSYGAGGVSRFRAKGVEVVLDFYFNKGIPAVAMLPRNKVDTRSSIANDRVADDPDLLKKLEDQGRLAFTPAGAHDDHFLLSYAMNKGIDIISNDRFQKEVAEQETHVDARKLRDFLNEHLIPYTFVHGEFCPNPKQTQLGRSIHHSRTRT